MTAKEWQQTVRVMKLKWPNFHWSDDQVKSAYDSLKEIDVRFVERAIEQSFKSGVDFAPNASNIYASAMEIQRYEWNDPGVPQLQSPKGSLKDYLLSNGYESFIHAMYESCKKRFENGKQEPYEVDTYDYTKSWQEVKADYSQKYGGLMTKIFTDEEEVEDGVSE